MVAGTNDNGGNAVKGAKGLKVGYVPWSADLRAPGDRRRFVYYAQKRGIEFEIARPAAEYDLVYISASGDFTPWIDHPRGETRIVFEIIDSYLSIPRLEPKALLRGLAKYVTGQNRRLLLDYHRGLQRMCARADAVVCSTEEQRATILPFCPHVYPVLDFHTTVVQTRKTSFRAATPFKFGWEGLAGNVAFFSEIREALTKINARHPLEIHAVTDLQYGQYLKGNYGKRRAADLANRVADNIHLHAWEESTVAQILTSCDMGLIPVALDQPVNANKPENKLLLFWRMGIPTVTSATPAYQRTMRDAGLEMCCRDLKDWEEVLERYIVDESARREASRRGLDFVQANHSEERLLEKWDSLFASLGLVEREVAHAPIH